MSFSIIPVIGILLILIGIWKEKKKYAKIFLIVGILFLLMTLDMIFCVKCF